MTVPRPTQPRAHGRMLLACALLSLAAGCERQGPARQAVSGRVTLDGRPLAAGAILFAPTGGTTGPKAAGPIKDGRFALPAEEGPVVGRQAVEIWPASTEPIEPTEPAERVASPAAPETAAAHAGAGHGASPTGGGAVEPNLTIPERYNVHTTLTVEVRAAGPNDFPFDLTTTSTP